MGKYQQKKAKINITASQFCISLNLDWLLNVYYQWNQGLAKWFWYLTCIYWKLLLNAYSTRESVATNYGVERSLDLSGTYFRRHGKQKN